MITEHRREQIHNAFHDLFECLVVDVDEDGNKIAPENPFYPFHICALRREFVSWTQLDLQGVLPAICISTADGGSVIDSPTIDELEETYPMAVHVVMKAGRGFVYDEDTDTWSFVEKARNDNDTEQEWTSLLRQYSNAHYTIGHLLNGSRHLVEGVSDVKIRNWRNSEEKLLPNYLYVKFTVDVIHRYRAYSNV